MRKIVLFCAGGMSTSLLVMRMQKAAEEQGYEADIAAYGVAAARDHQDADVVLLGPQIRHAKKQVMEQIPNAKVADIDMRSYGMMDGAKVLLQAQKLLGDR